MWFVCSIALSVQILLKMDRVDFAKYAVTFFEQCVVLLCDIPQLLLVIIIIVIILFWNYFYHPR